MIRHRVTALFAIWLALTFAWPSPAQNRSEAKFVWLSDLHFDPTANPKLVDLLAQANVDQWSTILASSPGGMSKFGQDSNWALLSSALNAVRANASEDQFTVVTGDLLTHHFRSKFESAAAKHDADSFARFASKTMQFVTGQLSGLLPGRPVLIALGNNDSECGNYELMPGGPFLQASSSSIANLLGPLADQAVQRDWQALGSYSVPHPTLPHVRVIAVNSVFFSPRYRNACAPNQPDPAREEMDWLEGKLAEAEHNHERVWLIFHIPPGIDGYASSQAATGDDPQKIVPMWKPVYTEQFANLLARFQKTVIVGLGGHEHLDDFRLIGHSLVLLAPAVSPNVGQYPAFRTAAYRADGKIVDATTFYLPALGASLDGDSARTWKREYRFDEAWGVHGIDFTTVRKVYREVARQAGARDRWSNLYSVSRPQAKFVTPFTFPALFCAEGNMTEAAYSACVEARRARH